MADTALASNVAKSMNVSYYSTINTATLPRFSSGLILWNVRRGYKAFNLLAPALTGGSAPSPATAATITNKLPFYPCQITNDTVINATPDLTATASIGRLCAADLSVFAGTTSVTFAALSGTAAIGAFNDVRDYIQNVAPMSVPALQELAVTTKDYHTSVPMKNGVRAIAGPDVVQGVKPISFTGSEENTNNSVLVQSFTPATIQSVYFNIMANFTGTPGGPNESIIQTTGFMPDQPFRVSFSASNAAAAGVPFVKIVIVYLVTDPVNGQPLIIENSFQDAFDVSGVGDIIYRNFDLGTVPDNHYVAGIYATLSSGQFLEIQLTQKGTFEDTNFGGWRAMRWDNLGSQQTVEIKGTAMIEAVSIGPIADYVKAGAGRLTPALDTATWGHLRYVFNDPRLSALCRVYMGADIPGADQVVEEYKTEAAGVQARAGILDVLKTGAQLAGAILPAFAAGYPGGAAMAAGYPSSSIIAANSGNHAL